MNKRAQQWFPMTLDAAAGLQLSVHRGLWVNRSKVVGGVLQDILRRRRQKDRGR